MRFLLLILFAVPAFGAAYYVDSGRSADGDGTEASPYKNWGTVPWATLSAMTATQDVSVICNSRATWTGLGDTVVVSGSEGHYLRIIGDTHYQTNASGTAVWTPELGRTNRATFQGTGSGFVHYNDTHFTWLQGVCSSNYSWGGISLGTGNPTTGIHDIVITNCAVLSPLNNQGIAMVYGETGCHSITISHCIVSNTPLEGIYLGHYNWLQDTITNCVVEYCTVVDTGLGGTRVEGDIDIKPGVYGCIVRNNEVYRTTGTTNGSVSGVVCAANNAQIYGNKLHNCRYRPSPPEDNDWGYGVYLNADGADGTGKAITSALIYNNVIYSNDNSGIRLLATVAPMSGVKVFNNTIIGNGLAITGAGIESRGGQSIAFASTNNIVWGNYADVSTSAETTMTAGNNLIGTDPNLDADYKPLVGSGAINAGTDLSAYFTTDYTGATRSGAWDIGAYEYGAESGPNPPANASGVSGGVRFKGKASIK